VINQKSGVAKTTTSINIAAVWQKQNKKFGSSAKSVGRTQAESPA